MLRRRQINAASRARRRPINADPRASRLRSALLAATKRLLAATTPLRRLAHLIEKRLGAGGALHRAQDASRWPFERLAWTVERRLLWPLRERTAGWSPPGRGSGAVLGVVAVTPVALIGVGVLLLSGGGGGGAHEPPAAPLRVAVATPPSKPAQQEPKGSTLQGGAPSFGVGKSVKIGGEAKGESTDATATDSAGPGANTAAGDEGGASGQADGGGAATASNAKPVPAGPAAMKVAGHFAKAFVFYEVGKRLSRAKTVFGETATPQLAEALMKRPPRLPDNARVPRARVVNLVPGPRLGPAYTVSVSLLRVGLTSELRISLRHSETDGWMVSEILG
jgi:hypothetical protein